MAKAKKAVQDEPRIPMVDAATPPPTGATCQEASPLSAGAYIPCGAPADFTVFHEKDKRAYHMCQPCAAHNTGNRGGVVTASTASLGISAAQAAATEVAEEGQTISGFLLNLGPFFMRAREIEAGAVALRDESRRWKLPTTTDEDEAMVANVRRVNNSIKVAEGHWSGRTVFHAFHKKLVAAFGRAERPLLEAQQKGNDLHNRFVAERKEAARREEERRRRDAQELEMTRQREEAARLEEEALAREKASPDLSDRERAFVDIMAEMGDGYDPRQAAKRVGYKDEAMGPRLMTYTKILDPITAKREAAALRAQAAAVKAAPVAIDDVTVEPDITTTEGATTTRVEVVDEEAFIRAALSGSYGVPADCLTFKQSKVNELGRTLGALVERIPGLRLVKTTKVRG
ncbi:MAG: hypothetical protein ACYC2H_01190 [Thermoplasmatota archaeon]